MVRFGARPKRDGEGAMSFVMGQLSFAEMQQEKMGFMLQNVARRCIGQSGRNFSATDGADDTDGKKKVRVIRVIRGQ